MERLSIRTIVINKVVEEIMKQVKRENKDYFEDVVDFKISEGDLFITVENKYGREHTCSYTSEAVEILKRELNEKSNSLELLINEKETLVDMNGYFGDKLSDLYCIELNLKEEIGEIRKLLKELKG